MNNREALLRGLREQALNIRRNTWRALRAAGSGHMGGSLSAADLLAALYFHYLRLRPDEPDWPERDRFVLSKGHANTALGAVLAQAGFVDDGFLDTFYGFESLFGMHPDIKVPASRCRPAVSATASPSGLAWRSAPGCSGTARAPW